MKLCKDCKNFYVLKTQFSTYTNTRYCCNRIVIEEKFDLINGKSVVENKLWADCIDERKNEGNSNYLLCGEEGRYWEAK